MQKIISSEIFVCPGCKETFEFDHVDEYELVPCPMCGIEYMTIRKNHILKLEPFEFDQQNPENQIQSSSSGKLELR